MVTSTNQLLEMFRDYFPEFSDMSDALVKRYLLDAESIFSACNKAWIYLTAHLILLDKDAGMGSTGAVFDGGAGEHTSESIGRESVSMKTMAKRDEDTFYSVTPYGRKFLIFRDTCIPRVFSVRTF